ncbi:TPA: ead/Ea22-like family protein [Escherichia coli]|nr:ead/Ea22-like family protein [Escherichia coli]
MSEINYQALREAAVKATWGDWDSYKPHRGARGYEVRLSSQAIAQHVLKNNAEFIAAFNPKVALALLDEINALEETRINDVCRIAELTKQLESAKSKLNEQREYYEGVIADGSKRIAELEAREVVLPRAHDVHPLGPQSAKIFCEFHRSIVNRCADEIRKVGVKVSIKGN